MKRTLPVTIACFGEALWDVLPRGIFLGGAPLNVAYHLSRHGIRALPVTAVGRDFLGEEIRRRILDWGITEAYVASLRDRPTGTVRATLDSAGIASYRIGRRVAWDRIPISRRRYHPPAPAALVYGTLALRELPNREALNRLFAIWPKSCRVLDLNLRPPFDRPTAVDFALSRAELLKLNDAELGRVVDLPVQTVRQIERAAARLAQQRRLARICVTAGARGAGLLWEGRWYWEAARPVKVADTVGAGDAFLAALLNAVFARRLPPAKALARACRLGEFVAARDGATPPYRCDSNGRPR